MQATGPGAIQRLDLDDQTLVAAVWRNEVQPMAAIMGIHGPVRVV